jgi:hypothetical protein
MRVRVKELCAGAYINIGHDRLMYSTIEQIQFSFILVFTLVLFFSLFIDYI